MTDRIHDLLSKRESTHGSFSDVAEVAHGIGLLIARTHIRRSASPTSDGSPQFSAVQHEALRMIASKIGRIAAGDANELDHWEDIAGYAMLVVNDLRGQMKGEATSAVEGMSNPFAPRGNFSGPRPAE